MDIQIEITPIQMLHVDTEWEILAGVPGEPGLTVITARAEYGVTCIVSGSNIYARVHSELPQGVQISIRMLSSIGDSRGWVDLSSDVEVVLVAGVLGAEHGVVEITVIHSDGRSLLDQPLEIAYSLR